MVYSRPPMPLPGNPNLTIPSVDSEESPPSYEEAVGGSSGPPPIPPRNFGDSTAPSMPSRPPVLPPRPSRCSSPYPEVFSRPEGPPPTPSRPAGPPPMPLRPDVPPPIPSRPAGPPPVGPRPGSDISMPLDNSPKLLERPESITSVPSKPMNTTRSSFTSGSLGIDLTSRQMSQLDLDGSIDFDNVFPLVQPLDTFERATHEVPIPAGLNNRGRPIETNKFYGNMLVGNQTNAVWTHPYSLWYCKENPFLGIAVAHCTTAQRVLGPDNGSPQFLFNPIGIKSFVFSSPEFVNEQNTSLGFSHLKHMSAQVQLKKSENQFIHFPLVQGMGFVTAIYRNLIPRIQSAVAFRNFTPMGSSNNGQKYAITLENGITWLLYVTGPPVQLNLIDPNTIIGDRRVQGTVFQLVADFKDEIDSAAGCFPMDCELKSNVQGNIGEYSFHYTISGESSSGSTLMYALPHHELSFTEVMLPCKTASKLDSTVCGVMTGYITNSFHMRVEIPDNLAFEPFTTIPNAPSKPTYSSQVLETIGKAATQEVEGDVMNESNLDSMYFSGKALAKYAWILYCCHFILKDRALVCTLMPRLKQAMARFITNSQILPLKYDTTWGGIISSGTSSQDFGNSYYNDHHFHYSYHIITAAILGIVDREVGDKNWLPENRRWVETLIRDYANPSEKDQFFPVFRSFDWFNGHSWAKGLFESGDGKDQESSSEDVNASYSLKLWGIATQNTNLINIGNIQLGVLKTSLNSYFLYTDDNQIMPRELVGNKVSGIKFENKIDHTTYFGNQLQYIQMIHAIPITPASSFVRSARFVQEEWEQKLRPIVDSIDDGWKGIIMLNVALFDPNTSFKFFSSPSFTTKWLDGGQSWTWSLAYPGAFLD